MKAISEFSRGLGFAVRGFNYVYREGRGLARYALWPILITFTSLFLALRFVVQRASGWAAAIWTRPSGEELIDTLLRGLYYVYEPLVYLLGIALAIVTAAVASSLIAAPFNDALSSEIERRERGDEDEAPFSLASLAADLGLTFKMELSKLALYLGVMLPLFIASLIVPGAGQLLYAGFGFLFTLGYFALDYIDWPASRRGFDFRARLRILRAYWPRLVGFGLGISFLLAIPFLNLFFMPAAVAGGTLLFLDLEATREELMSLKKG